LTQNKNHIFYNLDLDSLIGQFLAVWQIALKMARLTGAMKFDEIAVQISSLLILIL
jgi:hypothetical protein